jgi:hypothetical protein
MEPTWHVNDDGSFTINGAGIAIGPCWPAIDGAALRPLGVAIARAESIRVQYRLPDEAALMLEFARDNDGLVLRSSLRGLAEAPHWVCPLAEAPVTGAARFAKQGLGFGGPSGWRDLGRGKETWTWDTALAAAFCTGAGATLAIAPLDHRRFLFQGTLANRVRTRGLVDRHLDRHEIRLECGFATERIPMPDRVLALPDLHVQGGARPLATMRRLAERVGARMQARPPHPPSYHWCSWYHRTCHFTHADLRDLLRGLATQSPRLPLQTIQIDDGYCDSPGDWLMPNGNFPKGLQAAFADIAAAGMRPGVWIAPFMVGCRSALFRDHPDWIVRGLDGSPVAEWTNYHGGAVASHNDEETYALDPSHPEVRAWLREVFRSLRRMGARFIKTDFMDWGLKDSTTIRRATPGRTGVEWFREVLAIIREEIGEDCFWLACISPFAPFIGFADGMRVANDTISEWADGAHGNMLEETHHDQWFNGVWWENDPDVVYLRSRFSKLTRTEALGLACWHGILGMSVNTSDPLPAMEAERLQWFRFLRPAPRRWTADLPFWHLDRPTRVAVKAFPEHGAWAVVVHNGGARPLTDRVRLAEAMGIERATVFLWTATGTERLGEAGELISDLPARGAALYWVSGRNAPPPVDLTLGGARD